ncbi:hypothetical protein [Pyrofollis japonicus]|uniref:hypothetical protein n=1 Tax=Pyrofollis japonicus TaxID=3060460 RepID=UPI00295B2F20|nr:hypothetical protein [Pyrofollis japonicus]
MEPVKGIVIGYIPLINIKSITTKDKNISIRLYTSNSKNIIPFTKEVKDDGLVIEAQSYVPLEEPVIIVLLLDDCSIRAEIKPPSISILRYNYSTTIMKHEHSAIALDKRIIDPLGFFYTNLTQQTNHHAARSNAIAKVSNTSSTVPSGSAKSPVLLLLLVASLVSVLDYLFSRRKSRQHD